MLKRDGFWVSNARVTLTDSTGNVTMAVTNRFGHFRFLDLKAGETYVLAATSRSYRVQPRGVFPSDDLANVDLVAEP